MNTKKISDLLPGDTILDGFGFKLKVEKTEKLPHLGTPRTKPQVRVHYITERGNRLYQSFRADREVTLV